MTLRPTFGEERTATQIAIDAETLERVQNGMALLQEKHGPNWIDKIDLDTLNLANAHTCVLGMMYGDYSDGVIELWGEEAASVCVVKNDHPSYLHGFVEPHPADYSALQEAWVHEIEAARG